MAPAIDYRNFADRRALITGGSSGIGLALARQLVTAGASVCVVARNQQRLDEAVAELAAMVKTSGQVAFGVSVDVGDREAVNASAAGIVERLGGLDLLINNAGIVYPAAIADISDELFDAMMRVNYFGTVYVTRAFLPTMIEGGGGQIAMVSSLAGVLGIYGYTAYAPSKFAVRGFGEALRQELLRHAIDVCMVLPPDTDTPQLHQENETKPEETKVLAGTVVPLTADAVAAATLTGLRRRRAEVVPGSGAKLVMFASQRMPRLTRWIMHRKLARFNARSLAQRSQSSGDGA